MVIFAEHAGTGSVIDIYDVENLYFGDGERKALMNGQILNSSSWTGPAEGMEIKYEEHNVLPG